MMKQKNMEIQEHLEAGKSLKSENSSLKNTKWHQGSYNRGIQ